MSTFTYKYYHVSCVMPNINIMLLYTNKFKITTELIQYSSKCNEKPVDDIKIGTFRRIKKLKPYPTRLAFAQPWRLLYYRNDSVINLFLYYCRSSSPSSSSAAIRTYRSKIPSWLSRFKDVLNARVIRPRSVPVYHAVEC